MKDKVIKKAYGKINLGLDVLRKLESGYHEMRMIMQQVELHDTVTLERIPGEDLVIETDTGLIPAGPDNLAYKAADLMRRTYDIREGVRIYIEKRIPIAAGMAGGSSDCAAVLTGMNELFELGVEESRLRELGVTLGADVPFCVMGGCALSEGIGEVLTPLKQPFDIPIVIAKPDINVSTGAVFGALHVETREHHPDMDATLSYMKERRLKEFAESLDNILEQVTGPMYPVIGELEEIMKNCGALGAIMSGSGPTVFGLFEDKEKAQQAVDEILAKNLSPAATVSRFHLE